MQEKERRVNSASRKGTIPSEHYEQAQLVSWFRKKYRGVRIFAIANGGWRSKATAAKLKAEGVSRGVPDLFVPECGLWVEMKRTVGGRLSPEQRDWIEYLRKVGNTVLVCYGAEDAKDQIDFYMKDFT